MPRRERTKLAKLLPVVLLVEFRALRYVDEAIFVINILGLLNILGRKCLFWHERLATALAHAYDVIEIREVRVMGLL